MAREVCNFYIGQGSVYSILCNPEIKTGPKIVEHIVQINTDAQSKNTGKYSVRVICTLENNVLPYQVLKN